MVFGIQYCTKGASLWPRRWSDGYGYDHPNERVNANLAYFQGLKSQGVNWVGLTCIDEAWERGEGRDDFLSFFRILEIPLALGMRVLVRTQPMVHVNKAMAGNPQWALDEFYAPFAQLLKPYDPKRVMWSLMPEPALLSTITPEGKVLPLSPTEFDANLPNETARLEDLENFLIQSLRPTLPTMTFGRSTPGWAHLAPHHDQVYEYDLISKSMDTNIVRTADFYWGSGDPTPLVKRAYDAHRARSERLTLSEWGWTGPEAEKSQREAQLAQVCALYKIPYARWQLSD